MRTHSYLVLFRHREFRTLWTSSGLGVAATTMSSLSLGTLVFAQNGLPFPHRGHDVWTFPRTACRARHPDVRSRHSPATPCIDRRVYRNGFRVRLAGDVAPRSRGTADHRARGGIHDVHRQWCPLGPHGGGVASRPVRGGALGNERLGRRHAGAGFRGEWVAASLPGRAADLLGRRRTGRACSSNHLAWHPRSPPHVAAPKPGCERPGAATGYC